MAIDYSQARRKNGEARLSRSMHHMGEGGFRKTGRGTSLGFVEPAPRPTATPDQHLLDLLKQAEAQPEGWRTYPSKVSPPPAPARTPQVPRRGR